MQITSYSKFRSNLKSYMDDCIANDEPIIINRSTDSGVVLLPLRKYKELDETEYIRSNKEYASHLVAIFTKMKSKSKKILDPESFKKLVK